MYTALDCLIEALYPLQVISTVLVFSEVIVWALRWIFIAIVILGVLFISYQNSAIVDERFLSWSLSAIPLYFVIFFSFAIGMISFLLIAFFNQLRHHVQIRKYRNEIKHLNNKIIQYESGDYEEEKGETEHQKESGNDEVPS